MFAAFAAKTRMANKTRLSSMLKWARRARPAHPVISGMLSRLPARRGRPTCSIAPKTATTASPSVNAADQRRYMTVTVSGVVENVHDNRVGVNKDACLAVGGATVEHNAVAHNAEVIDVRFDRDAV